MIGMIHPSQAWCLVITIWAITAIFKSKNFENEFVKEEKASLQQQQQQQQQDKPAASLDDNYFLSPTVAPIIITAPPLAIATDPPADEEGPENGIGTGSNIPANRPPVYYTADDISRLATRHAPLLVFDSVNATYPSDPGSFYKDYVVGGGNLDTVTPNTDALAVLDEQLPPTPLYYTYVLCERQLRLTYWVFYSTTHDSCRGAAIYSGGGGDGGRGGRRRIQKILKQGEARYEEGVERGRREEMEPPPPRRFGVWSQLTVFVQEEAVMAVIYYQGQGEERGFYTRFADQGTIELANGVAEDEDNSKMSNRTHPVVYVGRYTYGFFHNHTEEMTLAQNTADVGEDDSVGGGGGGGGTANSTVTPAVVDQVNKTEGPAFGNRSNITAGDVVGVANYTEGPAISDFGIANNTEGPVLDGSGLSNATEAPGVGKEVNNTSEAPLVGDGSGSIVPTEGPTAVNLANSAGYNNSSDIVPPGSKRRLFSRQQEEKGSTTHYIRGGAGRLKKGTSLQFDSEIEHKHDAKAENSDSKFDVDDASNGLRKGQAVPPPTAPPLPSPTPLANDECCYWTDSHDGKGLSIPTWLQVTPMADTEWVQASTIGKEVLEGQWDDFMGASMPNCTMTACKGTASTSRARKQQQIEGSRGEDQGGGVGGGGGGGGGGEEQGEGCWRSDGCKESQCRSAADCEATSQEDDVHAGMCLSDCQGESAQYYYKDSFALPYSQ